MVAEPLQRALTFAPELEALERPRQVIAVRRAARDQVAERAQLVLLLGRHHEHPARASAHPERDGGPWPTADLRPCDASEDDAPVAEQPQRSEQIEQDRAPVADRRARILVFCAMHHKQMLCRLALRSRHARRIGQTRDRAAPRNLEPLRELQLFGGDRDAV